MTVQDIETAFEMVTDSQDDPTLDARTKLEMCDVLDCNPRTLQKELDKIGW